MRDIIERMMRDGVATFPAKPKLARVCTAMVDEFLRLVDEKPKGIISFSRLGETEVDLGLITRSGETVPGGNRTYDQKTFWHYTPGIERQFVQKNPAFYSRWQHLFQGCHTLFDDCEQTAREAGAALDDILPGYQCHHQFTGDSARERHTLRFLAYQSCRSDGGELARAHYDRSGLTLGLYESAPGLEYRTQSGLWTPMGSTAEENLIFPGRKLEQMTDGNIPALFHRVMPHMDQRPVRPGIIRVAVVFFAHPFGVDLALSTHER